MNDRPSHRLRLLPGAAAIVLMTLLVYTPAIRAGFIWDDDTHVQNNIALRSLGGLADIWLKIGATQQYYPMTFSSFWIEQHIFGHESATGYHVVNIVLHAINAVLVWLVLRQLRVPGAWLAAAVFAVHPVCVESVAWVTERKNVLCGLFYLSSMWCYLRSARLYSGDRETDGRSRALYWLALALFVGAVTSKTVACTLPAAILLITWWKRGRITIEDVRDVAPMLVLGVAMGLLTASLERQQIGARGPDWEFSITQRLLIAGRVVWFYAGKLFWPTNLMFIYERWAIDTSSWRQWLYPVTAAAVPLFLWLVRKRIGRGPLTAVLYFGGTLVPALGFINIFPMQFSFVADHFQYLASLGLISLAAAALTLLARQFGRAGGILKSAGSVAIISALGYLSWSQAKIYKTEESVWRDTLEKNPNSWMPHVNIGALLVKQGKSDEAIGHFERAVALKPISTTGADNWSMISTHNNWGLALAGKHQYRDAAIHFLVALRLQERQQIENQPALQNIRRNLDTTLELGRVDERTLERSIDFETGRERLQR